MKSGVFVTEASLAAYRSETCVSLLGAKENDGMMKGMMGANGLILVTICVPFTEKKEKQGLIKSVATLTYSVFICNYASGLVY